MSEDNKVSVKNGSTAAMLFRSFGGGICLAVHSPNTHLMERPRFMEVSLPR